ncbi:MAG TPA: hypothetical protein VK714_16625 [Myxococcota bacterium]|nr:hypothetical protein [Myxococcota bacterium]
MTEAEALALTPELPSERWLFRVAAAVALALHAVVVFGAPGLHGGEDLVPHLRLIELMRDQPGLHNVYAPAYHVLGALLSHWVGLDLYPRLFAFAGAAALMAGFRVFQRCAGLPAASAALFCFMPYAFSLSWCVPKVEAMGYALTLTGLGLLLRRRHVMVSIVLALTFFVHTAAALLFGLAGGILALASRDRGSLLALAAGTMLASPLFAVHVASGCTLREAFLFSRDDYLRGPLPWSFAGNPTELLLLASPLALVLAAAGAPALWRRHRAVAVSCAVLVVFYLNEIWFKPFGMGTTLDLRRGLTVLAIPVAASAGMALAARPRLAAPVVAFSGAFALSTTLFVVQSSCFVRPIDLAETREMTVQRCVFRWNGPAYWPGGRRLPGDSR